MEFFRKSLDLLAADPDTTIFLAFWLALMVLALIESRLPAFAGTPARRARWKTNIGLWLCMTALVTLAPVSGVIAAGWARAENFGLFNYFGVPEAVSFVASFFIRSLMGFGYHVATHKVPLMWRVHRVHHSDHHLDVTTSLRVHPAEQVMFIAVIVPAALMLGLSPLALIVYELLEALNSLFCHTNVRLPDWMDRRLRLFIITPNMHAVHHSSWQPETDSNYGVLLSVWDRLFGTYTEAPRGGYEGLKIGLDEIDPKKAASFWWQFVSPLFRLKSLNDGKANEPSVR